MNQGMLTISRRCIPFTPLELEDLSSATVTLVSATGVHLSDQEPFTTAGSGDVTYREIPAFTEPEDLRITHSQYDHAEADTDTNIVFPLATLRDMADEGMIAEISPIHFSYGFTTRLRELYETTFPEIADRIEHSRTKVVLMTAGCPETCHRSIGHLAREIESRGISTLIITASPPATESSRPPRAMTWDGIEIGKLVGSAGDRSWHRRVVRAALGLLTQDTRPGRCVTCRLV